MKAEVWFALFAFWFILGILTGDLGSWLLGKRHDSRPPRNDIRRPW